MSKDINVLVVEDSVDGYLLLLRELRKSGYPVNGNRVENSVDLDRALDTTN